MSEVAKVVFEGIKQLFGNNYVDLILYLSILLLALWLYREFRNKMVEDEKVRNEKVNSLLVILTDLEFELDEYMRTKSNFEKLKEKLINAYPFLSYNLSKKVSNFNPSIEDAYINKFIKELKEEKNGLKYNQHDGFSHINEKSILKLLEYHYKTKFETIISPFMMTIFSLSIILLFSLILISLSNFGTFLQKLYLILATFNSIIFIIVLIGLLDTAVNKKLKKKWSTWIFLILFFSISFTSAFFFPKLPYLPVVLFVFYLVSLSIFLPKIIKKID